MDARIRAIVVSDFCRGPGLGDVTEGETIEMTPYEYQTELGIGRIKPVPPDETEINAAALAQAHQELLQKITTAASVLSLEQLLSEDPEIAAAYEKRMAELEEVAGKEEADQIKAAMATAASEEDAVVLVHAAQTIVALNLLADEIPADEVALHSAISERLAELESAKG
jgi:hypothetical protein